MHAANYAVDAAAAEAGSAAGTIWGISFIIVCYEIVHEVHKNERSVETMNSNSKLIIINC